MASPFATRAMTIEQWLEIVKNQVKEIIDNGGVATILAHPACMEIADGFKTFKKICKFLSKYRNIRMNEVYPLSGDK